MYPWLFKQDRGWGRLLKVAKVLNVWSLKREVRQPSTVRTVARNPRSTINDTDLRNITAVRRHCVTSGWRQSSRTYANALFVHLKIQLVSSLTHSFDRSRTRHIYVLARTFTPLLKIYSPLFLHSLLTRQLIDASMLNSAGIFFYVAQISQNISSFKCNFCSALASLTYMSSLLSLRNAALPFYH